MKNTMFPTIQPERNFGITQSEFRAAYSAARANPVTMGGIGLDWTTPANVAGACLSMRRHKDLLCDGAPFQKLDGFRELEVSFDLDA